MPILHVIQVKLVLFNFSINWIVSKTTDKNPLPEFFIRRTKTKQKQASNKKKIPAAKV